MFGRQKMYRAGVADAMQANAEFMQKQQAATEHAQNEVSRAIELTERAVTMLDGSLDDLRQQLNNKENEELYKMHLTMDIRQLDEREKHLLVAVLYQLASERKKNLTEPQRIYLKNIRRYLGISFLQEIVDLNVVSAIDSLEVQKVLWECVLDFFYLLGGNKITRYIRIWKSKRKYLKYFSLNKKQSCAIEERVAHIYRILGPAGLADKYELIPDTIMPEMAENDSEPSASVNTTDDVEDCPSPESPKGNEPNNSGNTDSTEIQQTNSDSAVENTTDSSYAHNQATSQSPRASSTKHVGKNYGLTPSDVIKFAWMDATFAFERKKYERRRNRVQRAAAKIKKKEEKFYSDCNKIAAIRNASENTEDNE